jgi:hypothetical protein
MREELEAILVELFIADTNLVEHSFAAIVSEAAEHMGGWVLFDVRVDSDAAVQRIACLSFSDSRIAFLVLAANGTEISVKTPDTDLADFVAPLQTWFELPLQDRAKAPFRGSASLLLGALRHCGCFSK